MHLKYNCFCSGVGDLAAKKISYYDGAKSRTTKFYILEKALTRTSTIFTRSPSLVDLDANARNKFMASVRTESLLDFK